MPHIPRPVPRRLSPLAMMRPRRSLFLVALLLVLGLSVGLGWLVHTTLARKPKAAPLPPAPVMGTQTNRRALLADEPRTYDAIPKPPKPTLPPQGVPVTRPVEAATVRPEPARPPVRTAEVQPLQAPAGHSRAEIEAEIRAR